MKLLLAVAALSVAAISPANAQLPDSAQITDSVRADSVRADSVRRDSVRADSARVDSVHLAHPLAAVIVTSTRTERRIEDVPVRVEVLAGEDVDEKTSMQPGNLTQIVAEIPGVRVQPASPGAGGAALRVQGLPGQYSAFLTDGLPLTGTSEAGLSLVETSPLDLLQIEVLKGSASALYGPSALGGVVNFITRRPPASGRRPIRDLLVSGSSIGSVDAVAFLAARLDEQLGYTLLAGAHHDPLSDSDRDGWSDTPRSSRVEIRPRLFWRNARGATMLLTAGASSDDRLAGNTEIGITPEGPTFTDELNTRRADAGIIGKVPLSQGPVVNVRGSITGEDRTRLTWGERERDRSNIEFLEASLTGVSGSAEWVAGAAARRDAYRNVDVSGFDYAFVTTSAFSQLTAPLGRTLSASLTGRCDHHSSYGTTCTPYVALLAHEPREFTERLSAGLGRYAPTPLTEETQATGLARVRPAFTDDGRTFSFERASYLSADAGFRKGGIEINTTAYATRIANPVMLRDLASGPYASELVQSNGPTRSMGVDAFFVYTGDPLAVTAFYGVQRSRETVALPDGSRVQRDVPLNPAKRAGLDVALDFDETRSRVTAELYYTGRQALENNPYRDYSRSYSTLEILATQKIGGAQLFVSGENITNVRQTDFDRLLLPARTRNGRLTTDAWAPLQGRVVRAGIRAKF